ncbi:hypothetical protein [Pseudomonas sp. R5(2019)]|uniref:hypothetical protein n=1 Tax=Pseudomonas sp. R5(2019) TaxID=2697566 RepID=UPI001412FA67|nr:hypothetical protein [Pseudomonas sp. R5(2019)]NBA97153.1 hypothetical protein [Pseudomonas sp. R5(2019)]
MSTWNPWAALLFVGAPFLLAFVNILYSLYLSRRHLHAMLEALKNCRYFIGASLTLHQKGWFDRLFLVTIISSKVLIPKPGLMMGEMDPEDLNNFPPHYKRLLEIKLSIMLTAVIWGIAAYGISKLE